MKTIFLSLKFRKKSSLVSEVLIGLICRFLAWVLSLVSKEAEKEP